MRTGFIIFFVFALAYSGWLRFQGAHDGLPYLVHWDEPFISSSAINIAKTGDINPKYTEICYGGFLRYSCTLLDWVYLRYLITTGKISESGDVVTNLEGSLRTLSHPEFYLINRLFVGILSILGLVLVFKVTILITQQQGSGLIAALALMSFWPYFEGAIYATVDLPMTILAVGALYFSTLFHQTKRERHLILSFLFSGLSASTKLTGGLTILLPLMAVGMNWNLFQFTSYKHAIIRLFKWGSIPIFVFLVFNPNIITDTRSYLDWNSWIVNVYRSGEGHFSKEPGWEHLSFQVTTIIENVGSLLFFIALAGVFLLPFGFSKQTQKLEVDSKALLVLLLLIIFPVVYLLYVTSYRVAYHRNFLVLYPFVAIFVGVFCYRLQTVIDRFLPKNVTYLNRPWSYLGMLAITLAVTFPRFTAMQQAASKMYHARDTRTQAVDRLNLMNSELIGIAQELQFSLKDIERMKFNFRTFRSSQLQQALDENTLVLVGRYQSMDRSMHALDSELNRRISKSDLVDSIPGVSIFRDSTISAAGIPLRDPEILFIRGAGREDAIRSRGTSLIKQFSNIEMYSNGKRKLGEVNLSAGQYQLAINITSTAYEEVYPHIRLKLNGDFVGEKQIQSSSSTEFFDFSISEGGKQRFEIEFDNDAAGEAGDRNLLVVSFEIKVKN
ncbi:MAG: glycosyltransferase family 39 protein [Cyclobacteriaceae bacterium]|nr:glycosyltransferase family 39 protein [Cyclobacteriaceae bacterium]